MYLRISSVVSADDDREEPSADCVERVGPTAAETVETFACIDPGESKLINRTLAELIERKVTADEGPSSLDAAQRAPAADDIPLQGFHFGTMTLVSRRFIDMLSPPESALPSASSMATGAPVPAGAPVGAGLNTMLESEDATLVA